MSLLREIDQARARALARYQREQGDTEIEIPRAPEKPRPAPWIFTLLRLPLYLFFGGLPIFMLLGWAGLDIEAPFYLFGRSMLLLSTTGFCLTALAAFGRLPASWTREWRPARRSLVLQVVILSLIWLSLIIEMPWLSLLTPIFLLRPIVRLANASALRTMEEREILRLRAGLPPTPPIA